MRELPRRRLHKSVKRIKEELIANNKAISKHLVSSINSAFCSLNWLFVEDQIQEITMSADTFFLKFIKPNGKVYLYPEFKDCDKNILLPDVKDIKKPVNQRYSLFKHY